MSTTSTTTTSPDVPGSVASTTVAQIAAAMEPYLQLGDQQLSGAEWSVPVNTSLWTRYLTGFHGVSIAVDEHQRISRNVLLNLAEQTRNDPSVEALLSLFWNVLAWGVAGNFRNVGRIARAVSADPDTIAHQLRDAAQASYSGHPGVGFEILAGTVPQWGPAFFTKYLYFTTDTTDPAKVQSLILDDRVRMAWRCLAGDWLNLRSAAHYHRYCTIAGQIARGRGTQPGWLEGRLYQFGRQVGTYEHFADTQLAICRGRLADGFPTTADTWQAITGAETMGDSA